MAMSYEIGDRKWNDAETLVTFMVFDAANETPSGIIRGILMSRGIPFFFFEHTKAKPASITVPGSRLQDARRAVAEARKIGGEIAEKELFEDSKNRW
jgi:hypothetical protein